MKKLFLLLLASAAFVMAEAQDKKPVSPPMKAEGKSGGVGIAVNYSAPSAKGREIMGGLVPFDKIWRTGANKATTIEFDVDAKVEGKEIPKGVYSLFTIPGEKEWTIIFNSVSDQWGAYDYAEDKDVLRVTVKPKKTGKMVETFTISVLGEGVRLEWENTMVTFSVKKK